MHSFIRTQDVKGEPKALQPSLETRRLRVKRNLNSGCKLGTCNVHNLANTLFQLNDKDKDASAPPRKQTSYGRRRRSLALTRVQG